MGKKVVDVRKNVYVYTIMYNHLIVDDFKAELQESS